jgi:hypothetical protein
MYLTIIVGYSFYSCAQCANNRHALVRDFAVLCELVHCIFLEATQTAQLPNHHQISRGVDPFAKSAPANELANAHPGKVGVFPELHTL